MVQPCSLNIAFVFNCPVAERCGQSLINGGVWRGYLWIVAFMAAPMVALMRLQRHDWRMIDEMVGGMVAPVIVCFGLVRLGICPLTPLLSWLTPQNLYAMAHDAMLLGMIAVMVFRRRMYTNVAESDLMQAPQAHV